MANTPLELRVIAIEAFRLLIPLLEDHGERILIDDRTGEGCRRGHTVLVRETRMDANRWDPHSWELTERSTPVLLDHYETYAMPFDPGWLTLSIGRFSDLYLEPMAHVFAEAIKSQWPKGSTLVCAQPQMPGLNSGSSYHRVTDSRSKLSIFVARNYDILNHQDILGIGMLFGLMNAYQMNWFEQEQVLILTTARNRISTRLAELQKAA